MSYMHLYKTNKGDRKLYAISDGLGRPFQFNGLTWGGASTDANSSKAAAFVEGLTFKSTPSEKEPTMKNPKIVEALVEQLDKVATGLQADGNLDLAKAVDWISDIIENKVQ